MATNTQYSRTLAVNNGSTAAQFFVGRKLLFRLVTPCGSSDKDRALMDEIRKYGAMDRLISNNARAQSSAQVKGILRTFCIRIGKVSLISETRTMQSEHGRIPRRAPTTS